MDHLVKALFKGAVAALSQNHTKAASDLLTIIVQKKLKEKLNGKI